jgi:PH and SEC7 domain-containing protein
VHAVSYSILLLNTDLHVADLAAHMSRGQFVRNTLNAIQMQLHPERYVNPSTPDLTSDDSSSVRAHSRGEAELSVSLQSPKRSASITSWNSVPRGESTTSTGANTPADNEVAGKEVTKLPKQNTPTIVYDRNWELEMESLLKVSAPLDFVPYDF